FLGSRVGYAASEAALLRRHPENGRFVGLSPGTGALLAGGVAALLGAPPSTAALGALAQVVECWAAASGLRRQGVPAELALAASLRGQGWGLYYPARQLARYALLPAVALCLVAPRRRRRRLLFALAAALAVPSLLDQRRLRPRLPPQASARVRECSASRWSWCCPHAGIPPTAAADQTLRSRRASSRPLQGRTRLSQGLVRSDSKVIRDPAFRSFIIRFPSLSFPLLVPVLASSILSSPGSNQG